MVPYVMVVVLVVAVAMDVVPADATAFELPPQSSSTKTFCPVERRQGNGAKVFHACRSAVCNAP